MEVGVSGSDHYLSVDCSGVFSGVCVCVHGRKVTSLKHIQVQALHYTFYICTVGK